MTACYRKRQEPQGNNTTTSPRCHRSQNKPAPMTTGPSDYNLMPAHVKKLSPPMKKARRPETISSQSKRTSRENYRSHPPLPPGRKGNIHPTVSATARPIHDFRVLSNKRLLRQRVAMLWASLGITRPSGIVRVLLLTTFLAGGCYALSP